MRALRSKLDVRLKRFNNLKSVWFYYFIVLVDVVVDLANGCRPFVAC